ncbi:ATP-NAD kinase-like domain-containing protein [Linnemannia elongata]|nr:ATP-NAD kinase-like domain-containing protein [Linnemannia elongata]
MAAREHNTDEHTPTTSTTRTRTIPPTPLIASTPLIAPTPSRHFDLAMTPLTQANANIIYDTTDSTFVQTMAMVADAGADAGAAADAASGRSSTSSRHSAHSPASPLSPSSIASSSFSSTSTAHRSTHTHTTVTAAGTTATASSGATKNPAPLTSSTRVPSNRPSIEIPQPQSPITLHHALDGTFPSSVTAQKSSGTPTRILPRSIESCVQDTLAKDPSQHYGSSSYSGSGSNGQRRIMTPTSRLAETAVGVREVSKKIGRARVKWETPKTVMIVTKPGDESLLKITREIAKWMIASRGLTVFVDQQFKENPKFKYPSFLVSKKHKYDYTHSLKFWNADLCAQEAHLFDFAITLGGDGTVLFTSWLFQRIVPPILPFSAGSLGFLTPFPTIDYQQILGTCLDHGVRVNLRMRFSCTIYRCLEHRAVDKSKKKKRKGSRRRSKNNTPDHNADDSDDSDAHRRALPTVLTTPTETFEILNDLVLDRGPSANLSLLELFGDEEHLTTVQADGIVISTPTGSTAYSLAAGGPLTHPEIPAILISPICPHTLSFRPMLLPDSMELRICVPFDSRSTAWASFDGRGRVELKQGDHIKVTASVYPFPTICSSTQSSDWFHSLSRCLRWNERERQKGFTVVEHSRPKRNRQASSSILSPPGGRQSVGSGEGQQTPTAGAPPGIGNHIYMQGGTASNPNIDNAASLPPIPQHQFQGQGQDLHHVSGNGSASNSRVRLPNLRTGMTSPAIRKTSNGGQASEYFDHSPQDTDTMLTCWGTDTSESDEDDEDDSDVGSQEKECAEDGDGEWEEGTSSEEDDDDDDVGSAAARREAGLKGGGDLDRASLSMTDLTNGSGPIKALANKMQRATLGSNSSATGTGSGTDGTERGPSPVGHRPFS